jgi:3-hydroxyisobutyrate dehydrogenase-like beta-hydroxyacid dehydrogenase
MQPSTAPASDPTRLPRCGLIGLGAMGRGVGHRLRAAGIPLTVHSRTRARAEELLAAGADWAESPREVARAVGAGVILTALPEAKDVTRVLFGRRGVASGAAPGALVVDLSTVAPDQSRDLAARLEGRGIRFLDVPMGGSADAAREGRLLLYAGGPAEELRRAEPYLRPLAREIVPAGPVGSGSTLKLANNLLTIGMVELIAEAVSFAEASGMDRAAAIDVLQRGGARSAMLEGKREQLVRADYAPMFRLALARKDLRLAERAAGLVGQPLPGARQARRIFDRAIAEGRGDLDFSAVMETVRALGRSRPPPSPVPPASATSEGTSGAPLPGPGA